MDKKIKEFFSLAALSFTSYSNTNILGNAALIVHGNPSDIEIREIASNAKIFRKDGISTEICITSKITEINDFEYEIRHFFYNGIEDKACGHATLCAAKTVLHFKKFLLSLIKENNKLIELKFHVNKSFKENLDNPYMSVITDGVKFGLKLNQTSFQRISKETHFFHTFLKSVYSDKYSDLYLTGYNDYVAVCSDYQMFRKNKPTKDIIFEFFNEVPDYRLIVILCKPPNNTLSDIEIRVFCHDCPPPFFEDIANGSSNTATPSIILNTNLLGNEHFDRENELLKYRVLFPYDFENTSFYGGFQEIEFNYRSKVVIVNTEVEVLEERNFKFVNRNDLN